MIKEAFSVPSTDGVHELKGWLFLSDAPPKGILQVVHGMTDHIERYFPLMEDAAARGYVCAGVNHLGHAYSVDDQELGFIAHKHGDRLLYEDVWAAAKKLKARFPDLPYILLGHSMGSFVVRLAAGKYGDGMDGLIVIGTSGPNPLCGAGLIAAETMKALHGEKHVSDTLDRLAFGHYNDRTEKKTRYDWLSVSEDNRVSYAADPYCTFRFTDSAMADLVRLNRDCNCRAWYKKMPDSLPILLLAGGEDPVGQYGEGVKTVEKKLKKAGKRVKTVLFPGLRHEILNEKEADEVRGEIFSFADSVLPNTERKKGQNTMCIFCKIVEGEIPSKKAYEDELCLAFHDINPQAPVHILVIPKEHIESVDRITPENSAIVSHIFEVIPKIAAEAGLTNGYRVISNCGDDACQSVHHLHFHILGGRQMADQMA